MKNINKKILISVPLSLCIAMELIYIANRIGSDRIEQTIDFKPVKTDSSLIFGYVINTRVWDGIWYDTTFQKWYPEKNIELGLIIEEDRALTFLYTHNYCGKKIGKYKKRKLNRKFRHRL